MFRNVNNLLDSIPYFKNSSLRYNIHGLYHNWIGYQKERVGNLIGAKNEIKRRAKYDSYNKLKEKKNLVI